MNSRENHPDGQEVPLTVIEPRSGWHLVGIKEIGKYSEVLYFLTKRDIKVRYKQTILGGLWAVIQPFVSMIVFTIFFGKLAKVPSEGIPYPIFVYTGLLPWTYFANALSASGNSLIENTNLVTKVYIPRIIIPASAILSGLLDFFIALAVLGLMMIYYNFTPGSAVLIFPLLIGLTFFCALGVGLWLAALNVQYRDIRYAIPFLVHIWLFVSPVIYPVSLVSKPYQWLLALNPMGGLITAYRAALLGHQPVDWTLLMISALVIFCVFTSGAAYFNRVEKSFADVV